MWQQKLVELSEKAGASGCSEKFWTSCNDALSANGVTGIGYGIIPYSTDAKINGFSKAGFFKHTYPYDWASAAEEESLVDNDVSIELIINGAAEITWSELNTLEAASKSQRAQNEMENDIGMRFGASIELGQNGFGKAISGIGLWVGDTKSDEIFNPYWQEHRERIRQICHILDEGIRGNHVQFLVSLTLREQDCLTYLAIGLRPAEICWKLKISEKTFEKYVRGAKDKLRARTRDHAIAKALVLNLIRP